MAKRIAQLTKTNIEILCVSSHLGWDAFQMFSDLSMGIHWLKLHWEMYGFAYCNTEFQSFRTGFTVSKINTPGTEAKKLIKCPKETWLV